MAEHYSTKDTPHTAPGWESDARNSSFIMVYEDVWQALLKDPEALAVYMALRRRTHSGNRTWYATKKSMKEEAGVSLSTFERRIDVLMEHGLVQVTHQYRNPATGEISRIETDDFRQQIQNIYTVSEHTSGWYEQIAKSSNPTSRRDGATPERSDVSPHGEVGVTPDRGANIDPLHTTQTHNPNIPPTPQGGAVETSQQIELAKPKAKSVSKKGTRITPDWMPSPPVIEKMQAQFSDMDFFAVHEEFIDYWLGVPGQRGVKLDWDATWRNWIRRAGNRGNYPRTRGHASTPSPVGGHSRPVGGHSKADSKAIWYAQRAEELARKYAGGDPGAH